MFTIPDALVTFWRKRDAERQAEGLAPVARMGAADFRRIEAIWRAALPEPYKRFMATFGAVEFPDAFCVFEYRRPEPSGATRVAQGDIASMATAETLELAHRHLIANPDNASGKPFFPPDMLCFAGSAGTDQILLELGTATPRIWYWQDSNEAFGEPGNTQLGFVADSFEAFLGILRPLDHHRPAPDPAAGASTGTPLTPDAIDSVEQLAHARLPDSYRAFLSTTGPMAFDPPRDLTYERTEDGMTVVSRVSVGELLGADAIRAALERWFGPDTGDYLPAGFLPIALDASGLPILMGFGEDAGIWYLSGRVAHPWSAADRPLLHRLRPDFPGFASALR